eukprot:CAMPEP_0177162804 /NCGR_PEP_ID=MMETSP0367-20130122/6076_1 /TAXON_ID=447022 ORGANISM="Scrippsiella hangoei-like, Strain SHHI-4" /NCGR_SAMPLE_ID=MMETSP0367 /ASSEMBLY_ACC=CAM_ASM_000362 /LENGTH=76 /DNA_ID=CAMNT_0018608591 /DNA_START=190 /DNA_END=418 /DNA_ORIENTATION=+
MPPLHDEAQQASRGEVGHRFQVLQHSDPRVAESLSSKAHVGLELAPVADGNAGGASTDKGVKHGDTHAKVVKTNAA